MTTIDDLHVGGPGRFIARILSVSGAVAGVGVLVGPREVLTCAHVVNSALGHDQRSQDPPNAAVVIDFPLLDDPATLPSDTRREWCDGFPLRVEAQLATTWPGFAL